MCAFCNKCRFEKTKQKQTNNPNILCIFNYESHDVMILEKTFEFERLACALEWERSTKVVADDDVEVVRASACHSQLAM